MAYNYLDLVNECVRKVNEVELTSSTFSSSVGFYASVKDSVRHTVDEINNKESHWRFNFRTGSQLLTVGQVRYDFPINQQKIDFNTFRIVSNESLNTDTVFLEQKKYKEYLKYFSDVEYNTSDTIHSKPLFVTETPGTEYLIYPPADKAYRVEFDYYAAPTALFKWDDIPTIPSRYRSVIFNGSMRGVYNFREDEVGYQQAEAAFIQGLKDLKILEINRYVEVTSRMISRDNTGNGGSYYAK